MSIEARRHTPRILLSDTAYVNFDSGNRAVIIDVSEGGLRFKSAAPVDKSEPIRFQLAATRGVDGVAEVAWTDESRTIGGLRFTTVPAEIRQQVRDWIERGDDPARRATAAALRNEEELDALLKAAPPESRAAEQVAAAQERPASAALTTGEDFDEEPKVSYAAQFAVAVGEKDYPGELFRHTRHSPTSESSMSMFPSENPSARSLAYSASRERHPVAVGILVLLIVLGATAVVGEVYYPSQAKTLMSRAQTKVAQLVNLQHKQPIPDVEPASMAGAARFEGTFEPGKLADNTSAVPGTPNEPSSPGVTRSETSDKTTPQDNAVQQAPPAAGQISAPKTSSETELDLARTYLADGNSAEQKAKAVELLWMSTEKGNVDAEIQLADLYARGEAVQKSCVQARILLKAATAANPSAAKSKLDALDKSGCS